MLGRKARLVCRNTGIRKGGQLLDIGAGTGYFAATMVSRGWNVVAIEKNEHARDLAKRTFGLELRPAEALYSDMTHNSFDAVTLWHVMEHLEHLNETWERIGSLLKEQWAAYDVPRHLWHFTPSAIGRLASNHGFKLKGSYAMPFDAFYISMLSEKYAGSKHPFLSGMATGTAAWLKTLGNKELSSSMIYIFRKDKA
jgi:SAM-dependent methyltransferase